MLKLEDIILENRLEILEKIIFDNFFIELENIGFDGSRKISPKIVDVTLDNLLHPYSKRPIEVGIVSTPTRNIGSDNDLIESMILKASSRDYDIIVSPEYSFLSEKGPIEEKRKDNYLEIFKEASKNNKMIIPGTFVWKQEERMYNTAYVFYDGGIIFKYNKIRNGGDSLISSKYNLKVEYGKQLGTFYWDDLKLGIEVCADSGVLSKNGVDDRDLVFLISSGNSNLKKSMGAVKDSGYGIVVDGFFGHFRAEQKGV